MSQQQSWSLFSRLLHWIMAMGLIGNLIYGKIIDGMPLSPGKLGALKLHKSIGMTLLLLVVIRLIWLLVRPRPAPLEGIKRWQLRLSKLSHELLYLCMIVMPMSGWVINSAANVPMSWFGLFQLPNILGPDDSIKQTASTIHEITAWVFIGLITVHIMAALYHHVVLKDSTLKRMIRRQPGKDSVEEST